MSAKKRDTWEPRTLPAPIRCPILWPGLNAVALQPRGERVYQLPDHGETNGAITAAEDAELSVGVTSYKFADIDLDAIRRRLKRTSLFVPRVLIIALTETTHNGCIRRIYRSK